MTFVFEKTSRLEYSATFESFEELQIVLSHFRPKSRRLDFETSCEFLITLATSHSLITKKD